MTSSLRMDICGCDGAMAYRPLSFCGPSKSIPSVLPSREKEWQLAQVCMPVQQQPAARLADVAQPPGDQRHRRFGARGLMTPFSSSEGISGTSR